MKIEIKNRWGEEVMFSLETESLKLAVEAAVKSKTPLDGANLDGANLDGATLYGANLKGANLEGGDFTMPDGLPFSRYLKEVVPSLLTAGGKTLEQVLDTGCWECHSWDNCPMHAAFGIEKAEDGPALLVPRIQEFVQLFDANLIPKPSIN